MEEFKILDGRDSVRKRPGWYAGDVSDSRNLVKEILDNALDEAQKGYATEVYLRLDPKHGHVIADNSTKGFPLHEAVLPTGELTGRTVMEASVTYLSAGSKFDKAQVQAGANGTGSTVVNFLSKEYLMISNISRRKRFRPKFPKRVQKLWEKSKSRDFYYVRFRDGIFHSDGFVHSPADLDRSLAPLAHYSTIIRFQPDTSIVGSAESPVPENLRYVLKILEFQKRHVKVYVNDTPYDEKLPDNEFRFNVTVPCSPKTPNPSVTLLGSFGLSGDIFSARATGSVNGAITPRGRHMDLFRSAFSAAFRSTIGDQAEGFEMNGINLFLVLLANEVDFSSQAKTTLSRVPGLGSPAPAALQTEITKILKKNKDRFLEYYAKLINFKQKKGDLNKRREIDEILGTHIQDNSKASERRAGSFLPSKLMDAYGTDRSQCELFLVEGLSAASDFKKYRDPRLHAVLPLRGVPLNACGMDVSDVLRKSQELRDMVIGIGSGVDGNFNLRKLRYGRIILATDGDPDGQRIAALLCGALGAHCKYLLENGNIYMVQPPYYIQDGKFLYPGEESKLNHHRPFKRIKGLGSLGKDFPDAMINPRTRRLVRITPEGLQEGLRILADGKRKRRLLLETGAISETLYKG